MAAMPDPATVAARSERSAYAEATPPHGVCATCRGPVMVRACYNDYWQTPITRAPLLVEDANGIVFNGDISTLGLLNFGAQDGEIGEEDLAAIREYLGTVEAADAQRGGVAVELISDEAALQEAQNLAEQIKADLRALAGRMETSLQPWITEWENDGWWGAIGTFFSGVRDGVTAWWEGEGEFWSAVRDWIAGLPEAIGDAWDSMTDGARALWENRHRIVEMLQDLAEGAVNAFEQGIEVLAEILAAIPGLEEIAGILGDLVRRSAEWGGAMIEVATRTDVLRVMAATSLGVLMLVPPNFWTEVVGQGVGFLIPEAIIALVFLLIAAFTGGSGAPALAARLTAFAGRVATQLAARAARAGRVLGDLFTTLMRLVETLTDLVRAMLRGRRERAAGTTDREIPIVRSSASRVLATREDFMRRYGSRFSSEREADAAWRSYQQTSRSQNELVMGRLADTEAGEAMGMTRLNEPDWTPNVNDAWIQGGIDANKPFYLGSEITIANLRSGNPTYPTTVFYRELRQLREAGYHRVGDYMMPPQ